MNVKDLLAFRDFIGDVKGIIYRRAWEGVPHGTNKNENDSTQNQEEEIIISNNNDQFLNNINSSCNSNKNDSGVDSRSGNKNVIEGNDTRGRSLSNRNLGQYTSSPSLRGSNFPSMRKQTSTSDVELIESVIDDILDPSSCDRRKQG